MVAGDFAAQSIIAGANDIVIAAGVESMSRVPMGSARIGADPFGPSVTDRYAPGLVPQGVSAELIAARWGLSRNEIDEFAARSGLPDGVCSKLSAAIRQFLHRGGGSTSALR